MPTSPTTTLKRKRRDSSGLTVDATGAPAIDPTENVLSLVEAAQERGEAIRLLTQEVSNARFAHIEAVVALRAEHAKEIRTLEAGRLEKIREVDVLAGNTAAERAQVAITTLATVTSTNAETLRAMVANTAANIASQTAAANAALTERIAALEKSSYTGAGRSAVADPAMAELVSEMKMLRQAQTAGSGKSEGKSAMWGYVLGAVSFLGMVITIAIALLKVAR